MSLRTPLGTVRGLGSARSGTLHWWRQRLTAVANLPLVAFGIAFIVAHTGASHAEVVASIRNPFVTVGLVLAIASIAAHMRLGMQVIIEDYVAGEGRRTAALIANTFYCAAVGLIAAFAVLEISFSD